MELERLNETVIEQRDNITNSTKEVYTYVTHCLISVYIVVLFFCGLVPVA